MSVTLGLTVTLTPADADRRLARKRDLISAMVRDRLRAEMRALAHVSRDRLEMFTPKDSGATAHGWMVQELRDGFRVLNRLAATRAGRAKLKALEYGSEAHLIVARRARVLRFRGADGDAVFRRSVRHPGNAAYGMLRITRALGYQDLAVVRAELGQAVTQEWGKP